MASPKMFQKTQRENTSLIITDIVDTKLKWGSIEKVLCPLIIEAVYCQIIL